ncbi:type II toxin-antitoxin system VapC family toxin [Brevundimonas balnearis]|uniref:Type II toxin-antitoxin system VapC family toxin n=1 Tax=Brevundimonas balnearis TaxID=1572858 RepID=A0ABV6R440_9CAUL
MDSEPHVIDASAAVAFLMNEAGGERVGPLLPSGLMNAVNLTEVVTRLLRSGHDPIRAHYLGCSIVDHGVDLADRAGRLWPITAALGLSLGDRACLALAQREGLPVLTADRAWAALSLDVDVRLIR